MPGALETLKEKYGEVLDLHGAIALLHWDQEVYMPPKGAAARGRQLATLSALAHRLFTDGALSALLAELEGDTTLSGDDERLVAETRHDFDLATKLPEHFVATLAEEQSKAYQAWTQARTESRFALFQPHLEKLVELLRRKADYFGYADSPYDALLGEYERGMTTAALRVLFGDLAAKQSALLARLATAKQQPDTAWLAQTWDESAQWAITMQVLRDIGFDFDAGRQDKSVHPFTTNFDLYDVRVTTRLSSEEPFSALTGSIHEGGHALYEQGFRESDRRTILGQAISLGIHESQSRLWENMIGRSLPFWQHYTPLLRAHHGTKVDGIAPEQVYRAINAVAPSFIRVEADECSYNLHIVLRFEIETALIEGRLAVKDVPEAWNARFKELLGLEVPSDAQGCLQDIHWSHASMGYFPTYALGNLYAAQLMEKIQLDLPTLWTEVGRGNFAPLLGWLRTHVHQVGRRKTATQLITDATGTAPSPAAFLRYLEGKYLPLYGLA